MLDLTLKVMVGYVLNYSYSSFDPDSSSIQPYLVSGLKYRVPKTGLLSAIHRGTAWPILIQNDFKHTLSYAML